MGMGGYHSCLAGYSMAPSKSIVFFRVVSRLVFEVHPRTSFWYVKDGPPKSSEQQGCTKNAKKSARWPPFFRMKLFFRAFLIFDFSSTTLSPNRKVPNALAPHSQIRYPAACGISAGPWFKRVFLSEMFTSIKITVKYIDDTNSISNSLHLGETSADLSIGWDRKSPFS